jgi:hypothetical protein
VLSSSSKTPPILQPAQKNKRKKDQIGVHLITELGGTDKCVWLHRERETEREQEREISCIPSQSAVYGGSSSRFVLLAVARNSSHRTSLWKP